jgi:hypothetical protein
LGIVSARCRDEWSAADLALAAQLARTQADIEAETRLLHAEGTLLGAAINPRAVVVDQLIKRQLAMLRSLRMTGRVAGDTRDELGRRQTARKARKLRDDLKDDPLLA